MQAFECTGQWWLPGRDKEAALGTLKVSQSGNPRLWLVGALGQLVMFQSKNYPIILGWVDKSPFGNLVTLSECLMGGSTIGSSTITRENYHAARAYFGVHLEKPDDFAFKNMSLHVAGLSDWAHDYSGFVNENFPARGTEEPTSILSYAHKKPLVATVPGGRLTFHVGLGCHQTSRERSFHENVGLSISCETAKSPDQLNGDYVYPLQNLMTFVSDRPQDVEEFSVRSGQFPSHAAEPDIHVIGPRVQPEEEESEPEPVRFFQMLFTLADVNFSDFIGQWLQVMKTYEDACSVFFGLQYGPPAYLDMAFPGVVQSLYLYYFRREDGVALRAEEERRLKEILSALPPGDADWIVDRLGAQPVPPLQFVLRKLVAEHSDAMNPLVSRRQDRFVNEVSNTLKYILLRDADMDPAARHGAGLYWMMQKLRFLFKACLLREAGFKPDKVNELFNRNSFYQHIRALEAAEESQRQQIRL